MAGPSLLWIIWIAIFRFAGGFPLTPSVLQDFLGLHPELAGFGEPLVTSGFNFIDLLTLDLFLGPVDQGLKLLDGGGFDNVFDIAHGRAFAVS